MILSVIIVSYRVKFFLEQCLSSLRKAVAESALATGQTEVFIIDNASDDGSQDFLIPLFPEFRFIQNPDNTGFARASNQGLALSSGSFILFLNPDTLLPEDSLERCLSFFKSRTDAGALGLRMIDGAGNFLKESKRGFPSAAASFFKMNGLARVFPRSKKLAAYYMGHLPESEISPVDILPGAFMMVRKSILDRTGGFDEKFFMYGEDIDLSYRISQTGSQNYYLPETTIIHFKGESTRRDTRYVKMFYDAMAVFSDKHRLKNSSRITQWFTQAGIQFHRGLAYLNLPFQRKSMRRSPEPTVWIEGEISEQDRKKLETAGIRITDREAETRVRLFFEGDALSWKSIIREVEKNKNNRENLFHGRGTHALVGSPSSRAPGIVYELI